MEEKCLSFFKKNLEYFNLNYSEVYTKVLNFTDLLENKQISQRYELRYEKDKFKLFDLKSKSIFNNNETSTIKTITTISTEIFNKDFLKNQYFTPENLKSFSNLTKLIDLTKFNFNTLQNINTSKFIFIGLDIANGFQPIIDKMNCDTYLIIEPDIEIFYLSMFTLDYSAVAPNKQKIFSILDSASTLTTKLNEFYSLDFTKNYIFKYIQSNQSYNFIFNTISTSLLNNNPLKYTYKAMLNDLKYKNININIQKYKSIDFVNNSFKNKPILILSSGPSINNHIKDIIKYRKKFLIVAFAQTLKLLEKYNLKPDIVTIIDSSTKMEEFFKLTNKNFLNNTKLFSNNTIYPQIFSYFKRKNIYLFDKKEDNIFGITIGEATYHIVLKLKASAIYLLGVDLAFDKNMNSYEKSHTFNHKKGNLKNIDYTSNKKIDPLKSLIKVKGNFRNKVFTNIFFNQLIENYNYISTHYKSSETNVYNLSDGAYLNSTVAFKKYKKFNKLKKINKSFKIKTKDISIDNEKLAMELSNINALLFNDLFSAEIDTKYQFLLSLNNITNTILTIDSSNIYSIHRQHICFNYLNITLNFINYIIYSDFIFNYNIIYKIFSSQIKGILEEYKNSLTIK